MRPPDPPGLEAATHLCTLTAWIGARPEEVLICGRWVDRHSVPHHRGGADICWYLVGTRAGGPKSAAAAARAIMTTDTVPKEALARAEGFTVGAMAKGVAMLAPNMATMLARRMTHGGRGPRHPQARLATRRRRGPFNVMQSDASRSTNDTVLALAQRIGRHALTCRALADALTEACASLARSAADAEGATKASTSGWSGRPATAWRIRLLQGG